MSIFDYAHSIIIRVIFSFPEFVSAYEKLSQFKSYLYYKTTLCHKATLDV